MLNFCVKKRLSTTKMNNQDNHNPHHTGFWLGVIVGAAIVFLIATKKGKRILKLISEEGMEKLTRMVEDREIEEEDTAFEEPLIKTNGEELSPKKKRFFKRSK